MKHYFLTCIIVILVLSASAQTDSLLNSIQTTDTVQELFPKKILFTQKLAWGPHGFMRGGKTVTPEIREKDMLIRRKMLVAHQGLGVLTLVGFVGQAIVGPKLYKDPGNENLRSIHDILAVTVNTTYSLSAISSLFAPPALIQRDKGITSIRLHKWLAVIHLSGMLATNILAAQLENHPNLRPYHRAAAYTTFASFAAAMAVIKL
jgi:hypothetical protein